MATEKFEDDFLSKLSEAEMIRIMEDYLSQFSLEDNDETVNENNLNAWEDVPAEVLTHIFSLLPFEMLLTLSLVDKNTELLVKDNVLWKQKFEQYFPHRFKDLGDLEKKSGIDWRQEFRNAYESELSLWPKERQNLVAAIIRADVPSLEKKKLSTAMFYMQDEKGTNLFELAKKIGNQAVLDFFYQQAKKRYINPQGEIRRKIDEHGSTLFNWLINCNQSADELVSLCKSEEIARQLDEECNFHGHKPIHVAASEGRLILMKEMLKVNPWLLESTDTCNQTALLWAASKGYNNIVDYLIQQGAKIDILSHAITSSEFGMTPFHWAAKGGHLKVMQQLLKVGADPCLRSGDGSEPLHYAAEQDNVEVVAQLLQSGVDPKSLTNANIQPLLIAMIFNNVGVVRQLLALGIEFDDIDSQKLSNLLYRKQMDSDKRRKLIELFNGIQINHEENRNLLTSINLVAALGCLEMVILILEKQPDLLKQSEDWYQTIMLATKMGQAPVVAYLMEQNAELDVETKNKLLVVAMEYQHPALVALLLEKGADPLTKDATGRGIILCFASLQSLSPTHLKLIHSALEQSPELLKERDEGNLTPLMLAARHGHKDLVAELIASNAEELEAKDSDGWTALHWAALWGHSEVVRLLLDAKANFNVQATRDLSLPIHLAARAGHADAMKVLIETDPRVLEKKDNRGCTPLTCFVKYSAKEPDQAEEEGHYDFFKEQINEYAKQVESSEQLGFFLYDLFSAYYSYVVKKNLYPRDELNLCFSLIGDVNLIKNENGDTLLHFLAKECQSIDNKSDKKILKRIADLTISLMEHGADPRAENNDNHTAFNITRSPAAFLVFQYANEHINQKRSHARELASTQAMSDIYKEHLNINFNAAREQCQNLRANVDYLQTENSALKQENASLQNQMASMQAELQRIRGEKRKYHEPDSEQANVAHGKRIKAQEETTYKRKYSLLQGEGEKKEKRQTKRVRQDLSSLGHSTPDHPAFFQPQRVDNEGEKETVSQKKVDDPGYN